MSDEELTSVQRFVLVTLMVKASALPNTYLANVARISLKPQYRNDLRDRGLIKVTEKPLVLELTEKGWSQAIKELGAGVPERAGSAGGALYATLGFLRGLLDHLGAAPSELFTLRFGAADGKDLEGYIRKAYGQVAPRAGDYVPIARLREALQADIDAALVAMNRESGVNLIPNSQQGDLTADDRVAAVKIGNQDRHLIAISS